jgi:integrase
MQIEIKERPLAAGNKSLYLEYYQKGYRKRENLHLYLSPDDAPNARQTNERIYQQAREIRSQRILDPSYLESKGKEKDAESIHDITWLEWCDEYLQYCRDCHNVKKLYDQKVQICKHIAHYLESCSKTNILLKEVNKEVVSGFFIYLKRGYRNEKLIKTNGGRLSDFTLMLCDKIVRAMFNKAIREELMTLNPVFDLPREERFLMPDTHREYLTVEELQRFMAVVPDTQGERYVQKAFVFACMTGLRVSDMRRLKWSNLKEINGTMVVTIVQQKTKKEVSVPLNDIAMSLLPPRPDDGTDSNLFFLCKKNDWIATLVRKIAAKAGIEKNLTFHCSRHTAATLAVSAGAELYTVSKILGHESITCTQVYAKVNLGQKIDTVNLTKGIFD